MPDIDFIGDLFRSGHLSEEDATRLAEERIFGRQFHRYQNIVIDDPSLDDELNLMPCIACGIHMSKRDLLIHECKNDRKNSQSLQRI